jgi:hypothetical protein
MKQLKSATLIELLISIAVMIITISLITGILLAINTSYNTAQSYTNTQKSANNAIKIIGEHIRRADEIECYETEVDGTKNNIDCDDSSGIINTIILSETYEKEDGSTGILLSEIGSVLELNGNNACRNVAVNQYVPGYLYKRTITNLSDVNTFPLDINELNAIKLTNDTGDGWVSLFPGVINGGGSLFIVQKDLVKIQFYIKHPCTNDLEQFFENITLRG